MTGGSSWRWSFTMSLLLGFLIVGTQSRVSVLADPPRDDDAAVAFARETTESLIGALVAAVVDITERTTPETVMPNSQAVSLLLPKGHHPFGLLDGTGNPINPGNRPVGRFEKEAVARALNGETTQVVSGNELKTVIPLPFASANCALCHANYVEFEPGDIVGAVSMEVPLLGD